MSDIDWSKAPEDATHGRVTAAGFDFYRIFNGTWCYMAKSGNWEPAIIGNARLCVERPKAWNGESPPPTGTVCEFKRKLPGAPWKAATILCVGEKRVFFRDKDGDELSRDHSEVEFRPIRTPEQIAADKRLHEIRNALSAIKSKVHFPNDLVRGNILAAAVEAMIDEGYRKFEIVDE